MSQGFPNATKAMCKAGLVKESMRMRRIKREHAQMKRWLLVLYETQFSAMRHSGVLTEIKATMPELLKEKK